MANFTDQLNQQIQNTQVALAQAQKNAQGGWGGSKGQMADWQNKVVQAQANLQALQSQATTFQQIDQLGLGSNPQIQQLINQYLQNPGATNYQQNGQLLTQAVNQNAQLASQQQQLQQLQSGIQSQDFGAPTAAESAAGQGATMNDALTNNQGALGQLNQFETGQTAQAFNQLLSPEISMALGGQGLQNSGANVELQSKALAGLQLQQQQSVENAGLGMLSNLQGLQQQSTLGNIGTQQQNMANLQQQQNFYTTMNFQQSLMNQQAQLAQQLAQYGGGSSSNSGLQAGLSGALSGGMTGFMLGGPIGGAIGAVGGGVLGGMGGGQTGGGLAGLGGGLATNFFANRGGGGGMGIPNSPLPGLGQNAGPYPINPIQFTPP